MSVALRRGADYQPGSRDRQSPAWHPLRQLLGPSNRAKREIKGLFKRLTIGSSIVLGCGNTRLYQLSVRASYDLRVTGMLARARGEERSEPRQTFSVRPVWV